MPQILETVDINTAPDPTHAIIWLHGLGANAHDFVDIIPLLNLPPSKAVKFIFPNAPQIAVTVNAGYVMPAWYDILEMNALGRRVDHAGIVTSVARIAALVNQQNVLGIPSKRIFLAGFSQGGAIAYQTALTYSERLAGVIALSTYVPDLAQLEQAFQPVQMQLPIFVAHGLYDDVVIPTLGKQAYNLVTRLGCTAEWHDYPMAHNVCPEQIADIGQWLTEQLND